MTTMGRRYRIAIIGRSTRTVASGGGAVTMDLSTSSPINRETCAGGQHPPGDDGTVTLEDGRRIAVRLVRSFAESEHVTCLHVMQTRVVRWPWSAWFTSSSPVPTLDVRDLRIDWRTDRVTGSLDVLGERTRPIEGARFVCHLEM